MSEFRRLGAEVPFGETLVTVDAVRPIHDVVAQDLLLAARTADVRLADDRDTSVFGFSFMRTGYDDENSNSRYVTINLTHEETPDNWRLKARVKSYDDLHRHSAKWTHYIMQVAGDEVLEAKKQVYLVRGHYQVFVGRNQEIQEVTTSSRLCYERALTTRDCSDLHNLLGRTLLRAQAA